MPPTLVLSANAEFDLVFSSNGFFVWIADLQLVLSEIFRILRPGGQYVFYDIHPFQRPWKGPVMPIEIAKPYWETEAQMATWVRQAAVLPGWHGFDKL